MPSIAKQKGSVQAKIFLFHLAQILGLIKLIISAQADGCVCPNDILTYNCTVNGTATASTVWTGTAFDCPSSNQTVLLHSRFADGTTKECNNGGIVARSIGVENGEYTSELNVTVTAELLGKTIMCIYDLPSASEIYFSTIIPAPSPPRNIHISRADFVSRAITFNWNPAGSQDCLSSNYTILSSNCGSCPTTTTNTTVTCTDVPSDGGVCTFAVRAVVCDTLVPGSKSDTITLTLTKKGNNIAPESLPMLVVGVIMLVIAIVLITGFLLFKVNRIKSATKSRINQIPLHRNKIHTMEASIYNPACEETISTDVSNNFGNNNKAPIHLSRFMQKLRGQIADSQWHPFGLALGVPSEVLDQLQHLTLNDRIVQILDYWLQHHQGELTWQEVEDAKHKAELSCYKPVEEREYSTIDNLRDKNSPHVDNPPAKPPRRRSSVNKPNSMCVSGGYHIYDKTSYLK